jgi:hypothetical protein
LIALWRKHLLGGYFNSTEYRPENPHEGDAIAHNSSVTPQGCAQCDDINERGLERILFITPHSVSTLPFQMNERRGYGCYAIVPATPNPASIPSHVLISLSASLSTYSFAERIPQKY